MQAEQIHNLHGPRRARRLYHVPDRIAPRQRYVPAGRSLHLVDVENLMGGARAGDRSLALALNSYRELAPVADDDHVVIGSNPMLAFSVKEQWPQARLVVRGGPDGADIALLESVIDADFIAARYDRILIGSGDGVFGAVVREYQERGLAVGVISRERSLSYSLGMAASFVRILPDPPQMGEAA